MPDLDTLWDGCGNSCVKSVEVMIEVGQRVKVRRLRDRVSDQIIEKLGKVGTVQSFKMVDGSGVGMLVQFDDAFATWFFEDELQAVS